MTRNEAKLKIVRDTVISSILSELESELRDRLSDEEKVKEMKTLTCSKLLSILKTFNENELLPPKDFETSQDFEHHILIIEKKVKKLLLNELDKDVRD